MNFGLALNTRCYTSPWRVKTSMTTDPYRVAFESALAEVTKIAAKFEQLRIRKSHLENLVAALQPVFSGEIGDTASAAAQQSPVQEESGPQLVNETESPVGEEQASYSYLDVPAPLPAGDGDPFQRRVKTTFRFKGLAAQRTF